MHQPKQNNHTGFIGALAIIGILLHISCSDSIRIAQSLDEALPIYPDYMDIAIPFNIAPLNFMYREPCEAIEATIYAGDKRLLKASGKNKIRFPERKFKSLLDKHKNDTLTVKVQVKKESKWFAYPDFYWFVKPEPIDPFLSYRLIEPAYEVWHKINISQRDVTTFRERKLVDNNLIDNACINCHIGNKHVPGSSFFHLRHKNGGTIINKNGELRKIDTRTDSTLSAGIYGNWHPSGRFIAFSTNVIIPEFYAVHNKRMEVYDTVSDLIILDLKTNEVLTTPEISRKDKLETFPEFSADGHTLFFCVSDTTALPAGYQHVKYSLCSIAFDAETRTFGKTIDTLFSASKYNKTVSQPRVSPNGRHLLFTVFDYGNFPVWHAEARLYMLDLITSKIDTLPEVNNNENYSNSHHSWSSNNRWFVFASKRDNGMYGKPYFSFFDEKGFAHKPFVLPQKDPEFYDFFNKSYNIPELFEFDNGYNMGDVEHLFNLPAEKVRFVKVPPK